MTSGQEAHGEPFSEVQRLETVGGKPLYDYAKVWSMNAIVEMVDLN